MGKTLINFNEAFFGGDQRCVSRFKEFITEETNSVNQKNVKKYNIENFANCVMFSNEEHVWKMEKDDRRVNIVEARNARHPPEYFNTLANVPAQEVANFFYNRDIKTTHFGNYPKSKFRRDQIERSMTAVQQF